jgi:succinoglycan biosynthesis protein ExoA
VELNHRVDTAGLTCYFTPTIKIVYDPRLSFVGLFKQLGRYGAGRARLAAKHRDSLTVPALVPPLWLVWLVVGAAMSVVLPFVGWVYAASLLSYASVILGGSLWLARGHSWRVALRIPLVLVGIHFGFAWGFLREIARQLRGVRATAKS